MNALVFLKDRANTDYVIQKCIEVYCFQCIPNFLEEQKPGISKQYKARGPHKYKPFELTSRSPSNMVYWSLSKNVPSHMA